MSDRQRSIRALGTLFVLAGSTTLQADTLGGSIGANLWAQSFEASAFKGGSFIDFEAVFDIDDESDYQIYATLEHPVPLIPNILAQHTRSTTQGDGEVTSLIFDNVVFAGDVTGKLDLSHTDLTGYYEILDNWVSLDLGLTGRLFDGSVVIRGENGQQVDFDVDEFVPMFYTQAKFDLPLSGWHVKASGNWIEWDDDSVLDISGSLAWESTIGLGAEVGYRFMDIDYALGAADLDAQVEGVYGGLFWDF